MGSDGETLRYDEPDLPDHASAAELFELALAGRKDDPEINSALVGLALADDDRHFVEKWCIKLGREAPDLWLRGLACLCLGHLARRFGDLSPEAQRLVTDLVADPVVRAANPQVFDAAEDIEQYLRQSRPGPSATRSFLGAGVGGLLLIAFGIAAFAIAAATNGNGLECPAPEQDGDCPGFAFFVIDHAIYPVALGVLLVIAALLAALTLAARKRLRHGRL